MPGNGKVLKGTGVTAKDDCSTRAVKDCAGGNIFNLMNFHTPSVFFSSLYLLLFLRLKSVIY